MELAIVAAIAAVLSALISGWFARRRDQATVIQAKADAAETLTETALSLIAPINAQLAAVTKRLELLEKDNRELRTDNSRLRDRVSLLERQIVALGHVPLEHTPTALPATVRTTTSTVTVTEKENP